ncbi:hypothetical protein GFS24_06845 [Chitinophaga sp. SYP-B3965]|uniref:hypothetical protein n=1 Tax=Chitinophaga sp. SYP-B3965 TaxID=2663120 RepID=UPI00129965B8|nr:hypothetical protein [Chitinophaga sp. SYP-B3965]MRG44824.1 hypothetical protein [Chitinophaga sp. SYP-B3965]
MKRSGLLMVLVVAVALVLTGLRFFLFAKKEVAHYTSKPYQRDEMKYFLEIAPENGKVIIKWNKDIKVQILPGASPKDSAHVKAIIQELIPILGKIKISLVPANGNLTVNFVKSEEEYKKMANGIFDEGSPKGYAQPDFNKFRTRIESVAIVISPLAMGVVRGEVIRHEFGHALGFWEHSKSFYNEPNLMGRKSFKDIESAMKWRDSPHFTRLDKGALAILYNDNMPVAISHAELMKGIDTTK